MFPYIDAQYRCMLSIFHKWIVLVCSLCGIELLLDWYYPIRMLKLFFMQTKMRVSIAQIGINVTREKVNGKKLILQKISWRNHVKTG